MEPSNYINSFGELIDKILSGMLPPSRQPTTLHAVRAVPAVFIGTGIAEIQGTTDAEGNIVRSFSEEERMAGVLLLFAGPGEQPYPLCLTRKDFNRMLMELNRFDEHLAAEAARGNL